MIEQLGFGFLPSVTTREQIELKKLRDQTRKYWKDVFNWDGPKVGEYLQVGSCCVRKLGDDDLSYWYCAPCIAEEEIEPEVWIVRVEYRESDPEHCKALNGTKLILPIEDIWPCTLQLTRGN